MKHLTHRIIGSSILICCCIGLCSVFYLDLRQLGCKLIAQVHILNKEELTTIKIPVREFANNQSEILFQGSFYDVSTYTITGDTAIVTVWHDEDEEIVQHNIVCSVDATVQGNSNHHSGQFSKYKSYIPDGKIMGKVSSLSFYYPMENTGFPVHCSSQLSTCTLADVIKPPPDGLV